MKGAGVNVLDLALIVGALGVAAMTFTQAPITTAADVLACYAATILAGMLYERIAALPPFRVLPFPDQAGLRLGVFTVLLIGGALLLRRLARRATGLFSVARRASTPVIGSALAAVLSVLLALTVALVAVLAVAAVAQIPSNAGLPSLLRIQAASSFVLPHLAVPLDIYLRFVALWFGGTTPPVYANVAAVLHPL